MLATRKEVGVRRQLPLHDPRAHHLARLLGEPEAHHLRSLLLDERCPGQESVAVRHVRHLHAHQVTAPQLAVDRQVEQGDLASLAGHLQLGANRPLPMSYLGRTKTPNSQRRAGHSSNRTQAMGGRWWLTVCQESPWSSLTQREPVVLPKARRWPSAATSRAWR